MGYFSEMSMDLQNEPTPRFTEDEQAFRLGPPDGAEEPEAVAGQPPIEDGLLQPAAAAKAADEPEPDEDAPEAEEMEAADPESKEPEATDADEEKKRAEHEAAEAKRKEEWEAKQKAKKAAEKEQLDRLAAMNGDEVMMASMKRMSAETERLTRRNMKDCVSEYIQTRCLEDQALARLVMHPGKSVINCFHYINRKAREYIQKEMEDNDTKPENGVYGGDVPDDLCYQWAEDYFRDADAPEDKKEEEKFIPKPYVGKSASKSKPKKAAEKKKPEKKAEKKPPADDGQMTFGGQLAMGDFSLPEVKAS